MHRTIAWSFLCFALGICDADCVFGRQPNFIVIFCDNLGCADSGPFGSESHHTPNIDEMVQEGMRLTNFYSTCGVCTPSHCSLMTDCYPQRIGLYESEQGQRVLFPGIKREIKPSKTTIAKTPKHRGCATGFVRKWHLGDQREFLPTRHGFNSSFGIPFSNDMGKIDRSIKMYPPTPLLRNEEVVQLESGQRYLTVQYTEEALYFIEANQERPFFLCLPHSLPHWPQHAITNFENKSANNAWGDAVEEIDWSTRNFFTR